ncbi:hypothetical protein [Nocardia ninae]|nr:hypothetical protein [Nocardia ninae]
MFRSDPPATANRVAALKDYMSDNVLDGEVFTCVNAASCRRSAVRDQNKSTDPASIEFYEGQLSHIGPHYDIHVGEKPWRVMCLGMDVGRADPHIGLTRRREQQREAIDKPFTARHAHMRGTTTALRLAFARDTGRDPAGECLQLQNSPTPVHVMWAYALVNVRLCTVKQAHSVASLGTKAMAHNCFEHLAATMQILQPQLCIVQSTPLARLLAPRMDAYTPITEHLDLVQIGNATMLWAKFTHPAARTGDLNWGRSDSTPYITRVVRPTLHAAREYALG